MWPLSVRLALQGQPIATGHRSHDCCLSPRPRQCAQVSWEVLVESSPKEYGSDLNSISLYQLFFIFCLAPHLCSLGSPPQGGTCPQALISGSALRDYLTLSPEVTVNGVHMWGWGGVSTQPDQAVVEKLRELSGGSELSA